MFKKGAGLVILFFLSACTSDPKLCTKDDDCVPATCCHPNDAVNKAHAPDCRGLGCTMMCEPGTIDCGQGAIKCLENQCKAVIY